MRLVARASSEAKNGVQVTEVLPKTAAAKAGLRRGDVITRLGDYKVNSMQSYMEALGKFNPGDKTQVTVTREGRELTLPIELNSK